MKKQSKEFQFRYNSTYFDGNDSTNCRYSTNCKIFTITSLHNTVHIVIRC